MRVWNICMMRHTVPRRVATYALKAGSVARMSGRGEHAYGCIWMVCQPDAVGLLVVDDRAEAV